MLTPENEFYIQSVVYGSPDNFGDETTEISDRKIYNSHTKALEKANEIKKLYNVDLAIQYNESFSGYQLFYIEELLNL